MTPAEAAARLAAIKEQQHRAAQARIARARQESSKEPFDFEVFAALYDVSRDYGKEPVSAEIIEHYEDKYYAGPPSAANIREFAAALEELKLHDAS